MAQCTVKSCDICEKSPRSRFCTNCKQYFCKICEISHLKSTFFSNHVFKDTDIANTEVKKSICKHDKKFMYYCSVCASRNCDICFPYQSKHDCCHIDAAAPIFRSSLEQDISAAEDKIKRAKQEISTSRLTLKNFKDEADKAKKDIVERVDVIVNALNDTKIPI
ncbi:unnamed protein product [Mytilus edulis]|uniref:B box-type domain-containing protein n=1 Tax=Mytilus edulis TaxID=6550 RepID=A0A8S3TY21_MYTED|nr:unnamed protein product [Mytilus edulis]